MSTSDQDNPTQLLPAHESLAKALDEAFSAGDQSAVLTLIRLAKKTYFPPEHSETVFSAMLESLTVFDNDGMVDIDAIGAGVLTRRAEEDENMRIADMDEKFDDERASIKDELAENDATPIYLSELDGVPVPE